LYDDSTISSFGIRPRAETLGSGSRFGPLLTDNQEVDEVMEGGVAVEPTPDALDGSDAPKADETLEVTPLGVNFRECDVAEIVQEGAAEAGGAHPSVVVQVTMPPTLAAVVEPAAFRGAIRLLVEAACRDSEPGSDVAVRGKRADAGITVHVTDKGSGLDRDQVTAAFNGEEDADAGPAAGLALARRLVALHGGILWAEPLPAGGIKLAFTIPGKPPTLSDAELEEALQALEALRQLEADRLSAGEPGVESSEDTRELLDEAVDLAVAVTDGIAVEREMLSEPDRSVDEAVGLVLSLTDLMEIEPDAVPLVEEPVQTGDESEASDRVPFEAPIPDATAIAHETLAENEDEANAEAWTSLLSLADLIEVEPGAAPVEVEVPEPPAEVPKLEAPDLEIDMLDLEAKAPQLEAGLFSLEVGTAERDDDVEDYLVEPEPEPAEVNGHPVEMEPEVDEREGALLDLEPLTELAAIAGAVEPVPVVPAAVSVEPEPARPRLPRKPSPSKKFIPDPLHPATALLRGLVEDYDRDPDGMQVRHS
jgi:hypothetical protein